MKIPCMADSRCAYNYSDHTCVAESGVSYSTACSDLDGYMKCNTVTAGNGGSANLGCTFNVSTNSCDDILAFNDCTTFNNFPSDCEADTVNCGEYNYNTDVCGDTEPT